MNWRHRISAVERALTWPAWGLLATAWGLLAVNPRPPSALLAIGLAGLTLAMLAGSTLFLVWAYRRRTGTWIWLGIMWAGLGAINAWPLLAGEASSGTYLFALTAGTFAFWGTLALMMLRRDASLTLATLTLLALAWSLAVANARLGGPDRLLLLLMGEQASGRAWWFSSLTLAAMCIAPLAPVTFVGWLAYRLYQEFLGRGSI